MNSTFSPLRVYSWYVDSDYHLKGFQGKDATATDHGFSRQFHAWLEHEHPGAWAAGRVRAIKFSDYPD
jgi:hypothetical protein